MKTHLDIGKLLYRLRAHKDKIVLMALLGVIVSVFLYAFNNRYNHSASLDAVSYLSIAEKYADGLFVAAIDTYWSPFVSWIVALFIKLGADGLTGFALLNAFATAATLIIGLILIRKATKNSLPGQLLFLVVATPFLLNTRHEFSPDSLVITWSLGLVLVLLQADKIIARKPQLKNYAGAGALLGGFGALGYFIKLYLLFFFIGSIVLWTIYRIAVLYRRAGAANKQSLRDILLPTISAAVLLLAFAAPWVGAMSWKYKQPVLGTSLKQNVGNKFIEPSAANDQAVGMPNVSLSPPRDQHSVTDREGRPTSYGSRKNSKLNAQTTTTFLKNRATTLPQFLKVVSAVWVATIPVILLAAVVVLQKRFEGSAATTATYLVGAFSVYMGGYLVATMGPTVRYLWPLGMLGIVTASIILFGTYKKGKAPTKRMVAIASVLLFATVFYHSWPHPGNALEDGGRRNEYMIAAHFEDSTQEDLGNSRISGNNDRSQVHIAYAWGAQSYGSIKGSTEYSSKQVEAILDKHDIDYFLYFIPAVEYEAFVEDAPAGARLISSYTIGEYTCRDVRYDSKGAGLARENCIVNLYKIDD